MIGGLGKMGVQQFSIDKNELYSLLKKAVREVLHEEVFDIFLKSIPAASEKEMQDIVKTYGKPSRARKIARSEIMAV